MRKLLVLTLLVLAFDATAQSAARSRPPGTMPLEEPPPPPPMIDTDPALEPQVSMRVEGENTIEEYRLKGKLYMQRVRPKSGPSYILLDQRGDGTFSKQDNTLDNGNRVPQWVLLEF